MNLNIYPHTESDDIADSIAVSATDSDFAQFGPERVSLTPNAFSHPLVRVLVRMGHAIEFMGRPARRPEYINKVINPERENIGLDPL